MSEAFQPTLEYFFETVNPGVPDGTMIAEISFLPSSVVPVTAVTVTRPVMSVPELVMNALVPLMTHSLPSSDSRAVVVVPPASEPGAGLGQPERAEHRARSTAAAATRASAPRCRTGRSASRRARPPASSVMATDESTRASSSSAMQRAK